MATPAPVISETTINTNLDDLLEQRIGILFVVLIAAIVGLVITIYLAIFRVLKMPKGKKNMIKIADNIKIGAKAFLNKEYTYLSGFIVIMYLVIGLITDDWLETGFSFLAGAALSAICGYIGMLIAVEANVRTAEAARASLNQALIVSFGSGIY